MAFNLYGSDSDGESDNGLHIDSDEDDHDMYNESFQPITEDMLTLVVTRGLDDIYTGEGYPRLMYKSHTDLINGLMKWHLFFLKADPRRLDGHVTSVNLD